MFFFLLHMCNICTIKYFMQTTLLILVAILETLTHICNKITILSLVSLSFNDFYFISSTVLLLSGLWFFFFKLNSNNVKISTENKSNVNVIKVNSNSSLTGFYYYLILLCILCTYTIRGKNSVVWFDHFNLNNFSVSLLYIFLIVGFLITFLLKVITKKTNLVKSIDYLFSINNLILLLPYLFFVNTIFTFLFLIELISVILLYKLISSKIWFKNSVKSKTVNNNIPQNYINMVFFQYWVTFFSTIFIIYFYINIFYMYGTSDWFLIQFLKTTEYENSNTATVMLKMLLIIFLLSVFFKLGITPFHLFKVEVYKGIPYLSIFLYTTYYFVIFFLFFLFLLSDYLGAFTSQYYLFLILLLFAGSFYVIVLLFDVSFLKAFFTYSTIINTIGFFVVFLSSL